MPGLAHDTESLGRRVAGMLSAPGCRVRISKGAKRRCSGGQSLKCQGVGEAHTSKRVCRAGVQVQAGGGRNHGQGQGRCGVENGQRRGGVSVQGLRRKSCCLEPPPPSPSRQWLSHWKVSGRSVSSLKYFEHMMHFNRFIFLNS